MLKKLNRFNVIAPFYDRLAAVVFGADILESQLCFLTEVPPHAKVLVLGGGTGKWLNELLRINPTCVVYYVDASSKMLAIAKSRCNSKGQVNFIHGTEESIPDEKYEIVVTYFFVDLFDESKLDMLIRDIGEKLKVGGQWIVADFVRERNWHRLLLGVMYAFFAFLRAVDTTKLPDWQEIFIQNNYQVQKSKSFFRNFIKSCVYDKSS